MSQHSEAVNGEEHSLSPSLGQSAGRNLNGWTFFSGYKAVARHRPVGWIIKNRFQRNGVILVYAPTGVGKTATAIDLALCVAAGQDWRGFRTRHAPVIFIAAEDHDGVLQRCKGWHIEHGGTDADYHVLASTPNLADFNQVQRLHNTIKWQLDCDPGLIVVDTVQDTAGALDPQIGMKPYMDNVRWLQRQFTECTVLLVDHASGKNEDRGFKGDTKKADMSDCVIRLRKRSDHGIINMEWEKIRNAGLPESLGLTLDEVRLGELDEDGEELTASVVKPVVVDAESLGLTETKGPAKSDRILDALEKAGAGGIGFKDLGAATGISHSTLYDNLAKLQKKGRVTKDTGTGKWSLVV